MKRQHRLLSHLIAYVRCDACSVEDNLDRKSQLIDKYQNEIQERIQQMGNQPSNRRVHHQVTEHRSIQKSRLGSARKELASFKVGSSAVGLSDYQKLILGLEYSLQKERKSVELLQNNNTSLQAQLSNLRNLFLGSGQQKPYEKTMIKQYQDKISSLEEGIVQQKKNYQFIIDSKNEALASFQFQLRTVDKKMREEEREGGTSRKLLQLMGQIEQLRATLIKKSITIEKMRLHIEEDSSSESSNDSVKQKLRKNKMQFYSQQLQFSNKLILRKNMQLLNLSKKRDTYEQLLGVMQQYLDKKEVKKVDMSILEHVCVNKLRLHMRQKMVVEKELLNQLNECNQKLHQYQQQLSEKNATTGSKLMEVIGDNKRLTALVNTLQNSIKNLQKTLDDERRETEMQRNQVSINKRQFVQEIKKMKEEVTTISSVTKSEFDRMKMENMKLAQQNKSLLLLLGEKDNHKKGQTIRPFEDHKQKISSLDIEPPRRKNEKIEEEAPQMGTKLLLIDTFADWMAQWNKVRNWSNRKVLLNLILDKSEIREDSIKSMANVITVINEAFLNSKNIDVQERAIILLSHYLKYEILTNGSLFLLKIAPIVLRGFRSMLQGEDEEKLQLLNESTLKILSSMERSDFKWTHEMTDEMTSVKGLSQVNELIDASYNCLILISNQNEMISLMNSYNVTSILLTNANIEYQFLLHVLDLLRSLLKSQDYIKSQKSLFEFKKIYGILKNTDDPQIVDVTLDCVLLLMNNTLFVKNLNKIEIISILSQSIRNQSDYGILKKIGEVYQILVLDLQNENVAKMSRELDKLIDVLNAKKFKETRFNRVVRIILFVAETLIDSQDLDERIIKGVSFLYEFYDSLQAKTRIKLNNIISVIYARDKQMINKLSNESWIVNLVEAYQGSQVNEELVFFLRILLFQHEQRRTTEILRSGRENLINKHINDALLPDYNVALPALKNLTAIAKEKYSQKFMNKTMFSIIVSKILSSRNEQEYIGTAISILYYFCKNEETSVTILECGLLQRIFSLIMEKQDKDGLVYKCLSLIELCHTANYKRKILNYLLTQDPNMTILKTLSVILKKAKNKQEMGTRAVFIYDFLNGKSAVQSFAVLVQQNTWMIENLVDLRNEYVGKVDPLVYKIEILLHNVSVINAKIRKIYQKFKVQGNNQSEDDR